MLKFFRVWICTMAVVTAAPIFSANADRPNVLLICVDDLRPELNCYGVDYIDSPNIDALASRGIKFENHFVNAPTCGASRYTLLIGRYGGGRNDAIFKRAAAMKSGGDFTPSMPSWFRQSGYTTVSVGKVSHHPGGMGGEDWDDPENLEMPDAWDRHLLPAGPWQHPRGWMHGLANGRIRQIKNGTMPVIESVRGSDQVYPDGPSIDVAVKEIERLSAQPSPFFLAVGILRPHLPFGAPEQYLDRYRDIALPPIPHPNKPSGKTTWHRGGEIKTYDLLGHKVGDPVLSDQLRRHYAACVTYADANVGRLVEALRQNGQSQNTIIVLWGDHGYHLGEHAVWGKHTLFDESLHSPLIIVRPNQDQTIEDGGGRSVSRLVSSIDIYPTLCDLADLKTPDRLHGRSLAGLFESPRTIDNDENDAGVFATFRDGLKTIRTEHHRLIQHPDGFIELYDHRIDPDETRNVAEQQHGVAAALCKRIAGEFDDAPVRD